MEQALKPLGIHVHPLHEIPVTSIKGNTDDAVVLRTLRNTADKTHGFFMVRYHHLHVPTATFILAGNLDMCGRWMLGRVRQHRSQPGRFELLIRRSKVCYHRAVDTTAHVAQELRLLGEMGDEEFGEALRLNGAWDIVSDQEFVNLGFSDSNALSQVGY